MDPGSAVIAQSNLFPLAAQPPLPPSSSALSSLLDSTQCSANVAAKNTTLEAAAAGSHQASPDVRVLAGVRQKRDMPLLSGRPAKGNPLTGFAKKHGVGYAVGNQVAILSPALLSSSPPSAKQLRQNPYNYYSPPKPVPRNHVKIAQSKGRNLMLGTSTAGTSKSAGKRLASSPGSVHMERAGAVKWEIAQDKALIGGVRQQRWMTPEGEHRAAEEAREPSQFVEDDWERISRLVSSTGMQRSSRHCRRRWTWLHSHLGAAIMDFVDTSPTPQSSAQSTPVVPRDSEGVPSHMRNLRLADLPRSSPPIQPLRLRESRIDSTPSTSTQNTPAVLEPLRECDGAESRWDDPAYCQLLADVVQALSDPQSRAARVAKMYAVDSADKVGATSSSPSVSLVTSAPLSVAAGTGTIGLQQQQQQQPLQLILPPPPAILPVPSFGELPGIGNIAMNSSSLPLFGSSAQPVAGPPNMPLPLPSAIKSPTVTALATDDLAMHGPMDQDLNMYMQFLQSLATDHIDLGSAWSTLFDDTGATAPTLTPAPMAGVGPASMSIGEDEPAKLASDNKAGGEKDNESIEDDDMDDDDFVLDEDEEEDDDDDDDDDDAEYAESVSQPASGGLRPQSSGPETTDVLQPTGMSGGAWSLALNELGLGSVSMAPVVSLPFGSVTSGLDDSRRLFEPDSLLQQLMQGVADLGRSPGGNGVDSNSGNGDAIVSGQSVWLPNAASGSTMLPQWDVFNVSTAPSQSIESAAGKLADDSAVSARGVSEASKEAVQAKEGGASCTSSQQQKQSGDLQMQPPLPRRGLLKAPRKRHSAITVGSSSYKKAMLAAERAGVPAAATAAATATVTVTAVDTDGLLASETGAMDTEMTGLYQDALQEGEDLDVQEESQQTDSSEFLFMADQMAQLRAQQLMNFQFVVQAFLLTCAELGPHAPRARHWRRQLDQLALWHSLGTRESPTDLVSREGLARFAQLIESAERRRGGGGVTEFGTLAPNPASFFAIPGITAIIPDIYEAVDEIHRAAHVVPTADSESGSSNARVEAPEVRSLNSAMEFTPRCNCTALRGFKSAIVL
ncbi:hypothetical protein IWW38_003215, partial [Coemansia aciculifera]